MAALFGRNQVRGVGFLLIVMLWIGGAIPMQQARAAEATLVQTINTGAGGTWNPTSPDPSGITYWSTHDLLVVVDGEVEEMSIFKDANLYASTRQGALQATGDLTKITPRNVEPVGIDIAVDQETGTFFVSNDSEKVIYVLTFRKDDPERGKIKATVIDQFSTSAYGSSDPEGLTIGGGELYTVDAAGGKVYVTRPGSNGRFDGVAPEGDDTLHRSFGTAQAGVSDAEGIEYDSKTGTLYMVDRKTDIIAEVTTSGALIRTIKLRDLISGVRNPADLTLAPRSNGPGWSLYVVERGVDNNDDPNENDGKIYEVSVGSGSPTIDTEAPTAPTNLVALAASATQVALTWSPSTDNVGVTGYHIFRNSSSSPLATVGGTVTSYTDTTVSPSTSYSYVVKATDGTNVSAASNTANVTTPAGSSPSTSNLLLNPSFEIDANNDSKPDDWVINSSKVTRLCGSSVPSPGAHEGSCVAQFSATNDSGVTITQSTTNVAVGASYTLRGWTNIPAQNNGTFSFKLQVRWLDGSGSTINTVTVKTYSGTTSGWDEATTSATAPAGTASAVVRLVASSLNGAFYVDDLSLTRNP